MMKFVYWILNNPILQLFVVVEFGKDGDRLNFEKRSLNFSKFFVPFYKGKPKMYHGLLFLAKR